MNTPSNPNQDFVDGRTAMYITGPWATPQVQAVADRQRLHRRVAAAGRSGAIRTPWSMAGCGA